MIYGRDVAVDYPVMDLYDTGMMNTYLTAVKDEYERGIKEQDEFISKYGDFISPFRKDVETWDRLTMDPIIEAYDQMQAAGIDPLRSQEGRALLASIRRRVPRDTLSKLKLSAAAGQEYLKNRAELLAKGAYNPEFELFLLDGRSFNDWDTTLTGMWDRTSPVEFRGLRTLTDPWFKNRTKKYKYTKNGYDYYGYDEDDMKSTVNDQMLVFLENDYGKFYYDKALRVAQSSRQPGESDESVRKRALDILTNDIVDVNRDYLLNDREVNPIYLENLKHQHALSRQREAAAAKSRGSGSGGNSNAYNYHQSSFIRGALSLIPGTQGNYSRYGADASAVYASANVKTAFNSWKRQHANDRNNNWSKYKKDFLSYTGKLTEDPDVTLSRFGDRLGRYAVDRSTNERYVVLDKADLTGMEGTDRYVRNSLGLVGNLSSENWGRYIGNGKNLLAAPTGRVFTKLDKSGRAAQYVQVNLYKSELQYDKDDPNTVSSINKKYLCQAYIPIQHGDPTPNNSSTVSIYPSQETFSTMDKYENGVRKVLGVKSGDTIQSVNSVW